MQPVNIHDAKTHFSRLIERAEQGEEIIIARAGKPVAKLVPLDGRRQRPREPGSMRGQFEVPDDFNDPLPEDLLDLFEGRS